MFGLKILGSFVQLRLHVVEVLGNQVGAHALQVQPLQVPPARVLESLLILVLLKFNACPILYQVPHQVTFPRQDLLLVCDLKCLQGNIQGAFMLFEAFAFESRRPGRILNHGL